MTSLETKLSKVGAALVTELGEIVYHYWRPVISAPMCIWAEDGENSFRSDFRQREQGITGTVDYYTKDEFDANVDKVQTALNSVCSNWQINSVQYEDDTKLIHYEWVFTVI